VVTGTLTGGRLRVDDELWLSPQDRRTRVRALQSLEVPRDEVAPGSRVAVNLSGVDHHEVKRGDAVVRREQWRPTTTFDASLTVLTSLDHDVSRKGAFAAYIGSGEQPVRLRVLGPPGAAIGPGDTGLVRLHLVSPAPLLPGDRYVLRESGRGETVGGGEVLDVAPVRPAGKAHPSRSVERVIEERGWLDADELEPLTGESRPPTVGRWLVSAVALAAAEARVRQAVLDAGAMGLDVATLDERDRAVLGTLDDISVAAGQARTANAPSDALEAHPYLAALEAAPFSPPGPEGVDRRELRELVRHGVVVERDGFYFARTAVNAAARRVAALLQHHPEGVTVAIVRDALGTTRRHAVPLLTELDATGVTRRRGDLRIAGPRLPQPE
jgi:selenocysteine-specific elongation factor